ncbi:MAG: radical SAM family heme chaperone HemW [Bacilli bacterium]
MVTAVYIHIPFCQNICPYCDFCKLFYHEDWVNKYLQALKKEIINNYKGEIIKTIYIGGGTPSCLDNQQLLMLFDIIKIINKDNDVEFTFECNIEDISLELVKLLKINGVNRISVGIQTFNDEFLKILHRFHTYKDVLLKISLLKKYFTNINVDLMYGFNNQTLEQLKNDLDMFLKLDINHISTYSLMIEPHTKFYIDKVKAIDDKIDYDMFLLINKTLKNNGFNHYEISNYTKNFVSRHNIGYWNNNFYYGFGLGASGYIDDVRYDNTRSLFKYLNGDYIKNFHRLSLNETMENTMILGLRKIAGVNMKKFIDKYQCEIKEIFIIDSLLASKKLLITGDNIHINNDFLYVSNDILINFIGL